MTSTQKTNAPVPDPDRPYTDALLSVANHLLGDNWYIAEDVSNDDAAEIIASEIKMRYPKMPMSDVDKWRCRHKRCEFCVHAKRNPPEISGCDNYIWCDAKRHVKGVSKPRPFCTLFTLKNDMRNR